MKEIIRYITEEFTKNLINLRWEFYQAPEDLSDFVLHTRKATDELGRRFVQAMVQEMNDQIRTMAARKRNWVVERKGDPKTLTTSMGDILFFKTLYTSKTERNEEGKMLECYLVDKVLGLEPNQTMTEDALANVYKEAVQTSYRKGGEAASPDGITKGAVKDILHNIQFPPNFTIPMVKKAVDYPYIDADEDHYHLQFQNKKGDLERNENGWKCNGAINKLIYVFEGIEPEAPKSKRNRLINPHYFCRGEEQANKDLWKKVFDYIDATYDLSKVKRVYVNLDGGRWIKTGYRGLADVMLVLDEFHLSKYIFKLTKHMKDTGVDAQKELYDCIRNESRNDFLEVVEKLRWCNPSEKDLKRIDEAANYIASNWTAAKLRLRKRS